MNDTLNLKPATWERLRKRLAARGGEAGELVDKAVNKYLDATQRTFDEIVAPLREEVARSGESPEEVDAFFREIIEESRSARGNASR